MKLRLALLVILASPPVSGAATQRTEVHEFAHRPQQYSEFGKEVAVEGDIVIVGGPNIVDEPPTKQGAAMAYHRSTEGLWALEDRLYSPRRGVQFGRAFAFHEEWAVFGDGYTPDFLGSAYLYRRVSGNWQFDVDLTPTDLRPGDGFGAGVAMSGSTLLVGKPGADQATFEEGGIEPTIDAGAILVYELGPHGWVQTQTLTPPLNQPTLFMGVEIATDGRTIVGNTVQSGDDIAVYVFERNGSHWRFAQRLVAPIQWGSDFTDYGRSVGVSGSDLVIGEPQDTTPWGVVQSRVHVYRRNQHGTWQLHQTLFASDGFGDLNGGDQFGASLAILDDKLLVGAWGQEPFGANSGKLYLFERDATGQWIQTMQMQRESGDAGDGLGYSVDLTDEFALSGAPGAEVEGVGAGAAYLFDLSLGKSLRPAIPNSTGRPADLVALGNRFADVGRLELHARHVPPSASVLFLASLQIGFHPFAGGSSGILWLDAPMARFADQLVVASREGEACIAVDTTAIPTSPPVAILPGDHWFFQAWYRDGTTSNFTDLRRVKFQ